MLGSEEIKTMISALGCGIGTEDFDLAKLRYHRVIIMTDADVDGSHIRTLLLTFFYRQMPALIEAGHVFIAQPPLFRAKRGRSETFIKDERALENFLVHRAVESRLVKLADGQELFGEALEKLLHRMMGYQKVMQTVERRGYARDVVEALLDRDVRGKAFFEDEEALRIVAAQLTHAGPRRDGRARRGTQRVDAADRGSVERLSAHGSHRRRFHHRRRLPDARRDLRRSARCGARPAKRSDRGAHDRHRARGRARTGRDAAEAQATESDDVAPAAGAPPAPTPAKNGPLQMRSLDEFVDHFIALGRKGIAVNRYKGLGEMNPDTLWATTMNPEIRTLLQVKADDHAEADQMFTTLMGDQVEPRRKFIEDTRTRRAQPRHLIWTTRRREVAPPLPDHA